MDSEQPTPYIDTSVLNCDLEAGALPVYLVGCAGRRVGKAYTEFRENSIIEIKIELV